MRIDSLVQPAQTQSMKNTTVLKAVIYMALIWTGTQFWVRFRAVRNLMDAPPLFSETARNNAGERSAR